MVMVYISGAAAQVQEAVLAGRPVIVQCIDSTYGVRTASFDEIRRTNAPCVYVEAEFHDGTAGAEWIIENAEEIGEAICRGICDGAGVSYIAPFDETEQAKAWAVSEGFIRGYANGDYGWKDALTREQLAVIAYRMGKKAGEANG